MTQQTQRPRRSYAFVWTLVLLLFLCELTLAAGATLWYKSDAILPGVRVDVGSAMGIAMDIDLGGMTPAEAKLTLLKAWQAKTITVRAANNAWTLPITQLGYQLDADTMVQIAHSQGRTPASVVELLRTRTPAPVETLWKLEPVSQ